MLSKTILPDIMEEAQKIAQEYCYSIGAAYDFLIMGLTEKQVRLVMSAGTSTGLPENPYEQRWGVFPTTLYHLAQDIREEIFKANLLKVSELIDHWSA